MLNQTLWSIFICMPRLNYTYIYNPGILYDQRCHYLCIDQRIDLYNGLWSQIMLLAFSVVLRNSDIEFLCKEDVHQIKSSMISTTWLPSFSIIWKSWFFSLYKTKRHKDSVNYTWPVSSIGRIYEGHKMIPGSLAYFCFRT